MSETFPDLSRDSVTLKQSLAYDPSLRSETEDGHVISRRKYTGEKQRFELEYANLSAADKVLLKAMETTVGVGADTILWTNTDPNDSAVYTVRLEKPIEFEVDPSDYDVWSASLVFIEA